MLCPPKTTRPARQHPQELPYLLAAMGIPFTATLPIFSSSHRDGCQAASVSRAATWLGRRRGHSPAQNAVFRDVAAPGKCGATPRQAAGHYGEWLNWANALEQPPARLRGGLREGPQISVWSLASRKGALCDTPLEVRSRRVHLSVRNGDTHPRHTRRLLTSQTHKAGHPSPHCHSALSVPVLHVHRRVAV